MSEFLELLPPQAALNLFVEHITPARSSETVPTAAAAGRVTAAPVQARFALPSFRRATVDGYAVRAADTHGASESLPLYLQLTGEVRMGAAAPAGIAAGECMLIHTGGMLPDGADAVVMIEYTQRPAQREVEIWRSVSTGEHVLQVGEDIRSGERIVPAGKRLRPADVGALLALGVTEIEAARAPRVAVLSSGDEVVAPGQPLGPGQIYDINSYTLAALVREAGGAVETHAIIPDRREAFAAAAGAAMSNDLLVFTAGSSVSVRDLTAATIAGLGAPGVLVHGLSVRPGKPTILAVCNGKPVIGLPGNPVSALVIARLFVVPVIQLLLGAPLERVTTNVSATLGVNLASTSGREDWVPVRLESSENGWIARPLFGKSNLIFTLSRADGLLRIPPAATGLPAGAPVVVERL